MMLNVFNFSSATPVKISIKKLANFTPRDIVLETFLKSPLRMRLEKNFNFPVIRGKNMVIAGGKLKSRINSASNITANYNFSFISHSSLLRLTALQFFSRMGGVKASVIVPGGRSLCGLYQGASLSGLKSQEALVKGYPCNTLALNISLNKNLIKLHYETYSQI